MSIALCTMRRVTARASLAASLSALTALAACGGGDGSEQVTLVHRPAAYGESLSYRHMRQQIEQRSIVPIAVQCGRYVHDGRQDGELEDVLVNPTLVYYTFSAADAESVRDLPWWSVVNDWWRSHIQAPSDCETAMFADGDEAAHVTFIQLMPQYDGTPTNTLAESFDAMTRQVGESGVTPVRVQCGIWSADPGKPRGAQAQPMAWVGGYSPDLVYYTFLADDAARVRDLPWFRAVDDDWRDTYVDPRDCPDFRPSGVPPSNLERL